MAKQVSKPQQPEQTAGAQPDARPDRRVFIRDLVLTARIGVHRHERLADQRVRINLDLWVEDSGPIDDDLDQVVCYDEVMKGIRRVVGQGHVNLVETLAERIADLCLADRRVHAARVRVEKLDVYEEADSVGVEIERRQRGTED